MITPRINIMRSFACAVCLATVICVVSSTCADIPVAESSHNRDPTHQQYDDHSSPDAGNSPLLSEADLTTFLSPLAELLSKTNGKGDGTVDPLGTASDLFMGARFGVTFLDLNPSDYDTDNGVRGSVGSSFEASSLLYSFGDIPKIGKEKLYETYKITGIESTATIQRYRRMLDQHFREMTDKYFGNSSSRNDDFIRDKSIDEHDQKLDNLLDPASDEVEGWQPMVLANGSKYLCKIPALADFVGTGKGQYRGDDDVLVDLLLQQLDDDSISEYSSNDVKDENDDDIAVKIRHDMVKAVMLRQSNRDTIASQHPELHRDEINALIDEETPNTTPADEEIKKAEKLLTPDGVVPSAIRDVIWARMNEAGHNTLCGVKSEGYWTYEGCWGSYIKQYHLSGNYEKVDVHYLGKGPMLKVTDGTKEEDLLFKIHPVRGPYMSIKYTNGSMCGVTKVSRTADVHLYCSGGSAEVDTITTGGIAKAIDSPTIEIEEPKICEYVVWLGTPAACLGALKARVGPFVSIKCRKVDLLISK